MLRAHLLRGFGLLLALGLAAAASDVGARGASPAACDPSACPAPCEPCPLPCVEACDSGSAVAAAR